MPAQLLTVQGSAVVQVQPEQMELLFDLVRQNKEYRKCVEKLDSDVERFFRALELAGVPGEQVKLNDYKVKIEYEGDGYRTAKILSGFSASYQFHLTLDLDQEILARILNLIAKTAGSIEVDVRFSVKDLQKWKDQALEVAITGAKSKAELIARAAGITLGPIQDIVYGNPQTHESVRKMNIETSDDDDSPTFLRDYILSLDNIALKEVVTISWQIMTGADGKP